METMTADAAKLYGRQLMDRENYVHMSLEATEPFMQRFWAQRAERELQSHRAWAARLGRVS